MLVTFFLGRGHARRRDLQDADESVLSAAGTGQACGPRASGRGNRAGSSGARGFAGGWRALFVAFEKLGI